MSEDDKSGCLRVLLVEDDPLVRETVYDALVDAGNKVKSCADMTSALQVLSQEAVDLLLSDVRLPDGSGLTLFRRLRLQQPRAAAILMTAYGKVEDAVAVMREGARDYLAKPFELDDLLARVETVRAELALRRHLAAARSPFGRERQIEGSSPAIERVRNMVASCAASEGSVLITGETGTGKELCARSVHLQSARAQGPFVAVNCAALVESIAESELFGHVRGAFTGAERERRGRFLAADGGTLFLDEIGSLPPPLQAKLLRAIETGTFEPVGSSHSRQTNVRIIAATNEDLSAAVAERRFREDLYFRLSVFEITMPPLRRRRSDIPVLLASFLEEFCERLGLKPPQLSPEAMARLLTYDYPGNVRELMHIVEYALAMARQGDIDVTHLPARLAHTSELPKGPEDDQPVPLARAMECFERAYIKHVLERTGGKRSAAARILGISRKSLWQKLRSQADS